MKNEIVDIFDENNKQIGIQKPLDVAHKTGLWHRIIHLWVYNSKGKILLQRRAKNKDVYPNLWDISAVGHIDVNETPKTSAIRESKEEIGLDVKVSDLEFFSIRKKETLYKKVRDNEFCYVYFLKFDGDVKQLKQHTEEVKSIKLISFEKLENELNNKSDIFVPRGDYYIEIIEKLKNKLNR